MVLHTSVQRAGEGTDDYSVEAWEQVAGLSVCEVAQGNEVSVEGAEGGGSAVQ